MAATTLTAIAVVASGLRGSDYPGQLYRVHLFRDAGLTIWNSEWYSGHYTLGYSVLFPPLGAWLGISLVGISSTIVAVMAFRSLANQARWRGSNTATVWFAAAMLVNLTVGRLTFGLGVAIGLCALISLQRRRQSVAIALAFATSLASPVAGLFLAIATTALTANAAATMQQPWRTPAVRLPTWMALAAMAPTGVIALIFPSPGIFPFRAGQLIGVIVTAAGLIVLLCKRYRTIGVASALTMAIAVPLFLIPNPLGGNLVRLPTIFAGPIIAGILLPERRRLVALGAVPLGIWMLLPLTSVTSNIGAESAHASFYQPMVAYVQQSGGPSGRIEIPFTAGHWETAYVASEIPIARGWERQTDMAKNPLFYDGSLDERSYRDWLSDNAVRWIAVPNVPIDHGGTAEIALLKSGEFPWLRTAWANDDWTVYEVIDSSPLVAAPGRLIRRDRDSFTIMIDEPGDVLVRVSYTPYWQLSGVGGCIIESEDGLTVIRAAKPGVATIRPDFTFDAAMEQPTNTC